jgi:hypothetical protein
MVTGKYLFNRDILSGHLCSENELGDPPFNVSSREAIPSRPVLVRLSLQGYSSSSGCNYINPLAV